MKYKHMASKQLNKLIFGVIVILIFSIVLDGFSIWRIHIKRIEVQNYVNFEKETIDSSISILDKTIQTSIDFKTPCRRNQLLFLSGFEGWPPELLERQMLKMYSNINTLDSLPYPYRSEEISKPREEFNNSKNKNLKSLYEGLLKQGMLETLAREVYDDSNCGFGDGLWMIVRPIISDSTYIGTQFNPDRRAKYAYQINGEYFEGGYDTRIFTIARTDTIRITSMIMRNAWTRIDTLLSEEQIVYDGTRWKVTEN